VSPPPSEVGESEEALAAKTLYVGNLPYDCTEEELRQLFASYGPVEEVRLIGAKGFAFVDVPVEKAAEAISSLNGKDFRGRALTVNEARPRGEGRGGRDRR